MPNKINLHKFKGTNSIVGKQPFSMVNLLRYTHLLHLNDTFNFAVKSFAKLSLVIIVRHYPPFPKQIGIQYVFFQIKISIISATTLILKLVNNLSNLNCLINIWSEEDRCTIEIKNIRKKISLSNYCVIVIIINLI